MSDLLIRNIPPALKRQIEASARKHKRSLSAEAKALLRKGLAVPEDSRKFGTLLFSLVPPEYRSDDYVFEYRAKCHRRPTSNDLAPHEYARKVATRVRIPC